MNDLMERACPIRYRLGVRAAVAWLMEQGVNEELAVFALVGSKHAPRYGVSSGRDRQDRGECKWSFT